MLDWLIVILSWTIAPFVMENLMKQITPIQLTVLKWVVGGIVGMVALGFFRDTVPAARAVDKTFYIKLIGILILSFVAAIFYQKLLKLHNADMVILFTMPITILLTAFIGQFVYTKPYTKRMWIGTFITVLGLVIFLADCRSNELKR